MDLRASAARRACLGSTLLAAALYRVNSGPGVAAVTVFLVTPDGIVLADPLNPEFAAWLRSELASRFPGKAVKWVIESYAGR